MANQTHLEILKKGRAAWNSWRSGLPRHSKPDLSAANLSGCDLSGFDLTEVNLTNTDLHSANLNTTNLDNADLSFAKLQGAKLNRSKLRQAQLGNTQLKDASMIKADLQDALLNWADLSFANLTSANLANVSLEYGILIMAIVEKANLKGAKLTQANMNGANLALADLSNANLKGALLCGANLNSAIFLRSDLTNAVMVGKMNLPQTDHQRSQAKHDSAPDEPLTLIATVANTNFGMAELTGAKLPDSLRDFQDTLGKIEDVSRNSRAIYIALIGLCVFALLTTATATDAQLILNDFYLTLPLVNASVPITLFFVCAPFLGLIVFFYLQMYLAHLWDLVAKLPSVFPDGLPLFKKIYPWMVNLVIETWQNAESWRSLNAFRAVIAILSAWGLLPVTCLIMTARFLVRHDPLGSYVLLATVVISVGATLYFYYRSVAMVRSSNVSGRRIIIIAILALTVLAGGYWATQRGLRGELPGSSAKLSNVDLSKQNLSGMDLRKADMRDANLSEADLTSTLLHSANLQQANFHKTIGLTVQQLSQAKTLKGAKLDSVLLIIIKEEYPHLLLN